MRNLAAGCWRPLDCGAWKPLGELKERYLLNRRYMLSLDTDRLLLHHEVLAGIVRRMDADPCDYAGWEAANCQLKGHFVGHYLSACAMAWAWHGDSVLRGRGEEIVERIWRCQQEHGDGWCFSIPQTYLQWLERKKPVWAPQYTAHKTLMGLLDMARYAGSERALEVLLGAAQWFLNWLQNKERSEIDDILDVETGGMLEAWADLYALTGDERARKLMDLYRRPRIFEAIREGRDVLTMMHANTTIPEALGYARAYEVLGDEDDLDVVKRFWRMAVEQRGTFATGGQTYNEVWTPPQQQAAYLGRDNQEHCVMYNLIRLADFLWRHTGEQVYLEYMERAFANGILAQQHDGTGMVAYYLPMHTGAKAVWGSEHHHFWCCHGTLVQIHNQEGQFMAYEREGEVLITQYHESELSVYGGSITICEDRIDTHYAPLHPSSGCRHVHAEGRSYLLKCRFAQSAGFKLSLRIPAWTAGLAKVTVGEESYSAQPGGVLTMERVWTDEMICVQLPTASVLVPLPDAPERAAFMIGDDVLVGITNDDTIRLSQQEACLRLQRTDPGSMRCESPRYRLNDGCRTIELIPLRYLRDETFTMYFTFCM